MPFEKKSNSVDPFKSPDHKLPEKFKANNPSGKNPYASENLNKRNLANLGPHDNNEKKGIFKKGISRGKFKEVLGRTSSPYIKMDKRKRVGLEKEMSWGKYGESISIKDLNSYSESLKKSKKGKPYQDRINVDQKINLLKEIKDK